MQILVILGFLVFATVLFVRQLRRRRQRWLRSLALPGTWRMEKLADQPDQPTHIQMLELRGQLNQGEYRLTQSNLDLTDGVETGRWLLEGTLFRLQPTAGANHLYELRLLEPRLVGLQSRQKR